MRIALLYGKQRFRQSGYPASAFDLARCGVFEPDKQFIAAGDRFRFCCVCDLRAGHRCVADRSSSDFGKLLDELAAGHRTVFLWATIGRVSP
jgi:hypothetical protein